MSRIHKDERGYKGWAAIIWYLLKIFIHILPSPLINLEGPHMEFPFTYTLTTHRPSLYHIIFPFNPPLHWLSEFPLTIPLASVSVLLRVEELGSVPDWCDCLEWSHQEVQEHSGRQRPWRQ